LDASAILKRLKQAVAEHWVKISLHATEEALAGEITRPEIESAMLNAQLLEDYPDWWLGPPCLIHGQTESGRSLHLVVSYADLPVTSIQRLLWDH
jgi:hypothetical protein